MRSVIREVDSVTVEERIYNDDDKLVEIRKTQVSGLKPRGRAIKGFSGFTEE